MSSGISIGPAAFGQVKTEHRKEISVLRFSPNGLLLASASADRQIFLWSKSAAADAPWSAHSTGPFRGHCKGISDLAWSPDSRYLASASDDCTVMIWATSAADAERPVRTLRGHESVVFCVAFSPLGTLLASGSFDESIRLWDVKNERCIRVIAAHSDPITSVAFNNDGSLLASSSFDGLIRVWRVDSGQCLKTLIDDDNPPVTLVKFTPNGKYLLAWSLDSCIRLWSSYMHHQLGKCVRQYRGHLNAKYCCAGDLFQWDGERAFVVAGSEDGAICIWDLQSAQLVAKADSPPKEGEAEEERAVLAIAVNPQSGEIVSSSLSLPFALDFWRITSPKKETEEEQNGENKSEL